jgi:hypothetical protein
VTQPLHEWMWMQLLGTDDGALHALPAGSAPPKAGICTLLFNPIYKFILIKNTKVAGTSVFLNFGGFCPPGITLEQAKVLLQRPAGSLGACPPESSCRHEGGRMHGHVQHCAIADSQS